MPDPLYLPTAGEIAHILRDGDDHRDRSPHYRCVHGCCGYAVIDHHQQEQLLEWAHELIGDSADDD